MNEVESLDIELTVLHGRLWVTLYGIDEDGGRYSISEDSLEASELQELFRTKDTGNA